MAKKTKKRVVLKASKSKRFIRPQEGRMVAGVCKAFANYFNIDVTLVRLFWVFLLLPGGLPGFFSYLVCAVVIPSES